MTTQVYRITQVMISPSPVARIDGVDTNGHEVRLEVERPLAERATPGRLLVLQWSLHDVPAVTEETATTSTPTPTTTAPRMEPAVVDQEFMELMARGRRGGAPPTATQGRSIDSELTTLLGSAGAKGQK